VAVPRCVAHTAHRRSCVSPQHLRSPLHDPRHHHTAHCRPLSKNPCPLYALHSHTRLPPPQPCTHAPLMHGPCLQTTRAIKASSLFHLESSISIRVWVICRARTTRASIRCHTSYSTWLPLSHRWVCNAPLCLLMHPPTTWGEQYAWAQLNDRFTDHQSSSNAVHYLSLARGTCS